MLAAVQRVLDLNNAGAPILSSSQSFVFCNNLIVSVEGDPVLPHGDLNSVFTSSQSSFMFINGKKVIRATDQDTCGHVRVGGSPNVFSS